MWLAVKSREEINADLNRAENYTEANVKAALAAGARYAGQQELRNGRRNPVPRVMKPGVASDPRRSEYAGVGQLDAKLNKTHNVKDAGKLLAAMRRAAR